MSTIFSLDMIKQNNPRKKEEALKKHILEMFGKRIREAGDVKAPADTPPDAMGDTSTMTDTGGDSNGAPAADTGTATSGPSATGGSTGPSGTDAGDGSTETGDASAGAPSDSGDMFGGEGGGGGGGGGAGFGGGGEATGEEEKTEKPEIESDDPVSFVVDSVKELVKTSQDVPSVLKTIKAGLQYNVKSREQLGDIISQLKAENNPTISAAISRLETFLGKVQERKMTIKGSKLTEEDVRLLVRKRIEEQLNEFSGTPNKLDVSALRNMVELARSHAYTFESNFVKEFGLLDLNSMDPESQKIFIQAMKELTQKFIAAVMDAAKQVEYLPKPQEDKKKA